MWYRVGAICEGYIGGSLVPVKFSLLLGRGYMAFHCIWFFKLSIFLQSLLFFIYMYICTVHI